MEHNVIIRSLEMYILRDLAAFASIVACGSSFWVWGQVLAQGM